MPVIGTAGAVFAGMALSMCDIRLGKAGASQEEFYGARYDCMAVGVQHALATRSPYRCRLLERRRHVRIFWLT